MKRNANSPVLYRAQRTSSFKVQTPAPSKGLNTIDNFAAMDADYALNLTNFIASPQGCAPRKGYQKWATGFLEPVQTLFTYNGRTREDNRLFAVSGTGFYNITTGGVIGAPAFTVVDNQSNRYQQAMQTSPAGVNYLFAVNGTRMPVFFNGTAWASTTAAATPNAIGQFSATDNNGNPINHSRFSDVILHQQRLWFVQKDTSRAFYLPIGAAGGQLSAFEFGAYFPRGGSLHKLASWTIDSGGNSGVQSMLVAISTKGDVVVYTGQDPAQATEFRMIGQYQLGAPVGQRCTSVYQGDLLYLSEDGLQPMSKYLQSARIDKTTALTYTISNTISALNSTFRDLPGFEVCIVPSENVLLLNIPQGTTGQNFQFCFHTITQAWSQFTGWPAVCLNLFNETLYFGGDDHVGIGFIGYKDGASIMGVGGDNIIATCLTAFSALNDQMPMGSIKSVQLVKPFFVTGQGDPKITVGVNTDFNLTPVQGSAGTSSVFGGFWDLSNWDDTRSTWNGTLVAYNEWSTPECYPGEYVSFSLSLSVTTDTVWSSTSWLISAGGQFGV